MPVGVALAILVTKGFLVGRAGYELSGVPLEAPAAEVRTVRPGEMILSSEVERPGGARLAAPVSVDVAGDKRTLETGTAMFRAIVAGGAGEALVGSKPTYCEPLRVNAKMAGKAVLDSAAFGIFGNALRTHSNSILCFVDADGDGRFESAFHSGAQRTADRVLTPIGPVAYDREAAEPVPGGRYGIAFAGTPGGKLAFDVRLVDAQGKRMVGRIPTAVDPKKLPQKVDLDPAEIEVVGYDAAAKTARVRVLRGLQPGVVTFGVGGLAEIVPKKDERKPRKDGQ